MAQQAKTTNVPETPEVEAADNEKTVPAPRPGSKRDEVVIEGKVVDGDNTEKPSVADRTKSFLKNNKKNLLSGVTATALIAAGVLVVRKRNTQGQDEAETSEA
jgi:hypothetical protein